MIAKEHLKQIRILDNQVKNKQLELESIRQKMTGCQAISYERKEGVSGSPNTKSPQEKYIQKYLDYQKELEAIIDELIEAKKETMKLIDQVEDANCIDVLYKRYFQYKKWEEIAVEKNYSYQGICKIHGKALQQLNNIINKRVYKSIQTKVIK